MNQMTSVWSGLSLQRQIVVVLASVGMFASVLLLARVATSPQMDLLYAGLDPAAAGEVISALEAEGADYDVRGTAIYVASGARDALRLTLASDGLPANGGQGYELLDSLSGFGTTSQMFDAAYWRAKEGELGRTITASRNVKSARVHISNPASGPFARNTQSSASVTVTTVTGTVSSDQATALRYLIASAVSGLDPQDVAIIDSRSGLVPVGDTELAGRAGHNDSLAERLRANITRLLEARVGRGAAIVEVSVETGTERESISEKTFDPDSRVAISTDSEETTSRANNTRSGAVTVASNLPDGEAESADRGSESSDSTTREVTNFEVSETRRDVLREPGALRRISVAALVDGLRDIGENGEAIWAPRPPSELEDLRDLVASAVGFDESRGDAITIRTLEFQAPEIPADPTPLSFIETLRLDVMELLQVSILAVVSLLLGLFVVRPILAGRRGSAAAQLPPPVAASASEGGTPLIEAASEFQSDLGTLTIASNANDIGPPDETDQNRAMRLRKLIETRQDDSVEVLRQWMHEPSEMAR